MTARGREDDRILEFLEQPSFTRRWANLSLTDDDLIKLQYSLMANPRAWGVIKKSRGLRKARFAPEESKQGKRGALRVLYVHIERFGWLLLCTVYAKNEMETISAEVIIEALNRQISDVEAELEKRYR